MDRIAPWPTSQKSRPRPGRPKKPLSLGPTRVNLTLDELELAKMVDRITAEVESHFRAATEIKAKMEKLTAGAVDELLKVKELKDVIERLNGAGLHEADAGPAADVPSSRREHWKQELDRDLEKLLIIGKLLEVVPPPAIQNEPAQSSTSAPVPSRRILVVDDDLTTIKIIRHFLQQENYLVSSSLSGVEGLKMALEERPSLILLDIMIPDLNGLQFLAAFRRNGENAGVPVVILSALTEETDILQGLQVGAADYITKPFSPQVLLAKIRKNITPGP